MLLRTAIALSATLTSVAAMASDDVRTKSSIFVERIDPQGSGARRVRLEPARQVSSGERLIYVVEYRNTGKRPVQGFTVTNPLPRTVRLDETVDGSELVSIDGGRSWGPLASLRVPMGANRTTSLLSAMASTSSGSRCQGPFSIWNFGVRPSAIATRPDAHWLGVRRAGLRQLR